MNFSRPVAPVHLVGSTLSSLRHRSCRLAEQLKKVIKQLRHAFERLDTKKDDKVSRVARSNGRTRDRLPRVDFCRPWHVMTGQVDVDELTECLEKLGMKQSKKQVRT